MSAASPCAGPGIRLRAYPYPFRAAATLCSDIDATKTVEHFLVLQEFLNSHEETVMGPGLGLEVGNSFFPYPAEDTFGLLCSRRRDREVIETLIHAGYIDCIHSWGYHSPHGRDHILRGLSELEERDCNISVWVDHSRAFSNFGKDTTRGAGDVPRSGCYHADVTLAHGVRFAWIGRSTAVVGQGVGPSPRRYMQVIDRAHLGRSARVLAKEIAKTASGYAHSERFALHAGNRLLRAHTLADGQRIWEFQRCLPHWSEAVGATSAGLGYCLRREVLSALVEGGGTMVVYTHLGQGSRNRPHFSPETKAGLRALAAEHRSGRILVTTTARLLAYHANRDALVWSTVSGSDGCSIVNIDRIDDKITGPIYPTVDDLQGLTFYVPDARRVKIAIRGRVVSRIQRNPPDETGRQSVSIPRTMLSYPSGLSGLRERTSVFVPGPSAAAQPPNVASLA